MASINTAPEKMLLGGLALTVLFAALGFASDHRSGPVLGSRPVPYANDVATAEQATVEATAPSASPTPALTNSGARYDAYPLQTCYVLRDGVDIRNQGNAQPAVLGQLDRSTAVSCRGLGQEPSWVRIEEGRFSGAYIALQSVSGDRPPSLVSRSSDPRGRQAIARRGTILSAPRSGANVLQRISPPQPLTVAGRVNGTDFFEVWLNNGGVGYVDASIFEPEPDTRHTSRRTPAPRSEPSRPSSPSTAAGPASAPASDAAAATKVVVQPNLINRTRMGRIDYPRDARRAREEGTVHFRLIVNERGRASNCTILNSSGSSSLDNATCSAFISTARFAPARNRLGQNISAPWESRMQWILGD